MIFWDLAREIFSDVQILFCYDIAQPNVIAKLKMIWQVIFAVLISISLEHNKPNYCYKYQSVSSMALWQPTAWLYDPFFHSCYKLCNRNVVCTCCSFILSNSFMFLPRVFESIICVCMLLMTNIVCVNIENRS